MMAATFEQIEEIKDIAIINRQIAVCFDDQETKILVGSIQEIVFDSESWNTTIICTEAKKQQKIVYSMILNHKLYKELQLMARTRNILTKHYDS